MLGTVDIMNIIYAFEKQHVSFEKDDFDIVRRELSPDFEIISCMTNKGMISTGKVRNMLLDEANGSFVNFIDDDDEIMPRYLTSILAAIGRDPSSDCIGINGYITFDGVNRKSWKISKEYGWPWYEKDNVYYRCPNHISPVRREIALKVAFPDIYNGEDAAYSQGILPYLKSETLVEEEIYHYKFVSKK